MLNLSVLKSLCGLKSGAQRFSAKFSPRVRRPAENDKVLENKPSVSDPIYELYAERERWRKAAYVG